MDNEKDVIHEFNYYFYSIGIQNGKKIDKPLNFLAFKRNSEKILQKETHLT